MSPAPATTRYDQLARLLPLCALFACGWWLFRAQHYTLVDDAYITFRYAVNLAQGHGLVWNPGDPVEGYTNLLWVLLLTPFALLKLDLVFPSALLSFLAACGCLELLHRITSRCWPERSWMIKLLPGLLVAVNPSFAYWSMSGMETPLFAFLILLSAHQLHEGRSDPRRRLLAAGCLAAAYLTRPEGLMVAAIFLSVELIAAKGSLVQRLRTLVIPALIIGVVVLIHLLLRLYYYGYPLPNTFYAKVILGGSTLGRGLRHLWAFLLAGGVVVLPGILALCTKSAARPYLVQGYALLAAYLTYLLIIGGDHNLWFRFYVPLLALPLLGLTEVAFRTAALWDQVLGDRVQRARRTVALLGRTLLLLALLAPLPFFWHHGEPSFAPIFGLANQVNRGVIEHFFRRQVPPESFAAVSAVGMIGYYTPLRILDSWGLNDQHIAHQRAEVKREVNFGHDKSDWPYVLRTLPDYIVTFKDPARWPPPGLSRELTQYELCWPSKMIDLLLIYRRTSRLEEHQLGLGMPTGLRRTLRLPPPCVAPLSPPGAR